jgi:hypothetical protein
LVNYFLTYNCQRLDFETLSKRTGQTIEGFGALVLATGGTKMASN